VLAMALSILNFDVANRIFLKANSVMSKLAVKWGFDLDFKQHYR
jgi:hypothetical protein